MKTDIKIGSVVSLILDAYETDREEWIDIILDVDDEETIYYGTPLNGDCPADVRIAPTLSYKNVLWSQGKIIE